MLYQLSLTCMSAKDISVSKLFDRSLKRVKLGTTSLKLCKFGFLSPRWFSMAFTNTLAMLPRSSCISKATLAPFLCPSSSLFIITSASYTYAFTSALSSSLSYLQSSLPISKTLSFFASPVCHEAGIRNIEHSCL